MFNKLQNQGFTLIELLTVILIIGILTAVAVPQYTRSVRRAEMTEGLTHGKTILDSAARYKALNGESPTNFNQLDIGFVGTNIEGATFNDGNFTYSLSNTSYVSAISNKGGYELRFGYPKETNNGIVAPIGCCPGNSTNGQWVCNQVAVSSITDSDIGTSCKEIY